MKGDEKPITKTEFYTLAILTVFVCWWLSYGLNSGAYLVFIYLLSLLAYAELR